MKAMILHNLVRPGASKDELDNIVQANAIAAALERLGHGIRRHAFSFDLNATRKALKREAPDFVFNLVESVEGVDRLIHLAPSLLDSLRVPYTGVGAEAMFLTTSKLLAKRSMRAAGLPTAAWVEQGIEDVLPFKPGRYIVKSVWEHASFGMDETALVDAADSATLHEALDARVERLGSESFAELFIDGREFNLSIINTPEGPRVFPPAEILFTNFPRDKPRLVDYRAKWDEETFEYQNTPRTFDFPASDAPLLRKLKNTALRSWRHFGLRGYARVDFRVDGAGRPFILEINANPCLAPDAGFASAAARAGCAYDAMIGLIVQDALATSPVVKS